MILFIKKNKLFKLLIFFFVFCFNFLFINSSFSINNLSDGYVIPGSGAVDIAARSYYCSTTLAQSSFAPTRTNVEWNTFLSNKPNYITCIPYCADNTTDYTAWSNTTCANNNLWNQTRSRTSTNCYHVQTTTRQSGSCDYCTGTQPQDQSCGIANGTGTQHRSRTCTNNNYDAWGAWGTCTVVSCNTDYYKSGNSCVLRSCNDNTTDYTSWNNNVCVPNNTYTSYNCMSPSCSYGDVIINYHTTSSCGYNNMDFYYETDCVTGVGTWSQSRIRTSTNCYDSQNKIRQNGSCDYCIGTQSQSQTCTIANGTGRQDRIRTCTNNNYDAWGGWGGCNVAYCNTDYVISGNSCILRNCNDDTTDYTDWALVACTNDNSWNYSRSRNGTNCNDVQAKTKKEGSCIYCTNSYDTTVRGDTICSNVGYKIAHHSCMTDYHYEFGSYTDFTCVCDAGYVSTTFALNCVRNCVFPTDYDLKSQVCINNNFYDVYYSKKTTSNCGVPYVEGYYTSTYGANDLLWCNIPGRLPTGIDCALVGDVPGHACKYCYLIGEKCSVAPGCFCPVGYQWSGFALDCTFFDSSQGPNEMCYWPGGDSPANCVNGSGRIANTIATSAPTCGVAYWKMCGSDNACP